MCVDGEDILKQLFNTRLMLRFHNREGTTTGGTEPRIRMLKIYLSSQHSPDRPGHKSSDGNDGDDADDNDGGVGDVLTIAICWLLARTSVQ